MARIKTDAEVDAWIESILSYVDRKESDRKSDIEYEIHNDREFTKLAKASETERTY